MDHPTRTIANLVRPLLVAFSLAGLGLQPGAALAAFPDKPIKIVTTAAPGAATDITSRLIAEHMSKTLKQQVIIESRPGGGGNIGVGYVAQATPDGYTLLVTSTAIVAAPFLYSKLSYDTEKSFAPVSGIVTYYNVLVAHPDFPPKSLPEFMTYAKEKPGQYGGRERWRRVLGHDAKA
jgi:tripartite-type tricarboxylate transporter receptor subunit TctC